MVWNAPPMTPDVKSTATYGLIKLMHVVVIAFAGIAGNVRLFQLLRSSAAARRVARRVLFAWLAGKSLSRQPAHLDCAALHRRAAIARRLSARRRVPREFLRRRFCAPSRISLALLIVKLNQYQP